MEKEDDVKHYRNYSQGEISLHYNIGQTANDNLKH